MKHLLRRRLAAGAAAALLVSHLTMTVFSAGTEPTDGLQLQTILAGDADKVWKTQSWDGENVLLNSNWTTLTLRDYYDKGYLQFEVRSTGSTKQAFRIGLRSKRHDDTQSVYWNAETAGTELVAGPEWAAFSLPIKAVVDGNPDVPFNLDHFWYIAFNRASGSDGMELRNVKITSTDDERQYPLVKVDQVGYLPGAEKTAYVSCFAKFGSLNGKAYEIVNAETGAVVRMGTLPDVSADDPVSGERVHPIRFDDLTTPGSYYIRVPQTGLDPAARSPRDVYEQLDVTALTSCTFRIAGDVYDALLSDLVHYFYLQRQGLDLEEAYAGVFARENLHPGDAAVRKWSDRDDPDAVTYDVSGGWYDAGDYGKYVCPAAGTLSDLLFAYELFPEVLGRITVSIPETDPANPRYVDAPGFLSEVKWELDMLRKLEHPSGDGSFYPAANYSGDTIYIEDTLKRTSKAGDEAELRSHDATAAMAAVFAHASLVYRNVPAYADFAAECLAVAERAWRWVNDPANEMHMSIEAANRTYSFSEDGLARSMFWAAGALSRARRISGVDDPSCEQYLAAHCRDAAVGNCFKPYSSMCYGHSGEAFLGFVHYLMQNEAPNSEIAAAFGSFKSWKSTRLNTKVWGTSCPAWSYWWGSNKIIAQSAASYLLGELALGETDGISDAVRRSMQGTADYLLGANPISFSYVSGHGENSVANIFSAIYTRDKRTDPYQIPAGYFTEGTNIYDNRHLSKFDGKCYIDSDGEFTTNENTIYGNAAMVLLMAALAAQEQPALTGDVNGDGALTTADAVLLARLIAEDSTLSPESLRLDQADTDGDTLLTIADAAQLLARLRN